MPELMCECGRCTANIVFREQDKVVRCKYCQYPNQRPQATGGTLDKLKRGNRLLQQCQFEEAEDCYKDVLRQYPDEAEALWGRLMCKYGVEVAKEEKYGTVRRYLLCHRARRSSIRNEGDFHDACKHADPLVREQYEKDAEYIDNVQQKIREVAERQESYDVFICYKETDLVTGERTRDSMIAQQLYNQYIYDGYRVFFARETLCDKMGEDYEAAIYQAIATAKVMLVVGLKKEHFQAVWPKSEWMRYLEKMEQGEGLLIPVYGEMKAEELPEQFTNLGLPGCCIETDLAYIEDIESKLYRIILKPVPQRRENSAAVSDKTQEMMYPDGKYVGEIVNGNRHGKGVMYYSIADDWKRRKYDGEWKNNWCHGKGVMYYSNGYEYDGEWKDNRYHGNGVYTWPDGSKYDGDWTKNKRNGKGVLTWSNGSKYDGEWKDDKRNGYGVMYYSNGNKYDGEWKDNERSGHGVFTWKDGIKFDGDWENDKRNGRGVYTRPNGLKYDGEFRDDQYNGHGVMYYSDEDEYNRVKYDGEWKDNKRSGHGVLTWKDGAEYDGEWKDSNRNSQGVYTRPDGTKYNGEWKDDHYNGHGVYTWPGGNKYDGEWIDGKRTGKGVYYYANGDRYEGEFYNGEFAGRGTFIKQSGKRIRFQDGKPKRFF